MRGCGGRSFGSERIFVALVCPEPPRPHASAVRFCSSSGSTQVLGLGKTVDGGIRPYTPASGSGASRKRDGVRPYTPALGPRASRKRDRSRKRRCGPESARSRRDRFCGNVRAQNIRSTVGPEGRRVGHGAPASPRAYRVGPPPSVHRGAGPSAGPSPSGACRRGRRGPPDTIRAGEPVA